MLRQLAFRWLDARVLDGIGEDLATDELLHQVEQSRVPQQSKGCRPEVDRGLGSDSLERQGDVEVRDHVQIARRLDQHAREALRKRQLRERRGQQTICMPGRDERVEQVLVLAHHRVQVALGIEHVVHNEEALLLEGVDVHPGSRSS